MLTRRFSRAFSEFKLDLVFSAAKVRATTRTTVRVKVDALLAGLRAERTPAAAVIGEILADPGVRQVVRE